MRLRTAAVVTVLGIVATGCGVSAGALTRVGQVTESSAAAPSASASPSISPSSASPTPSSAKPSVTPRPTAAPGFAARGPAQALNRVQTTDRVVFLTMDDGAIADPKLVAYLREQNIPVTMFLTTSTASADWQYWRDMTAFGSIQNHTVNHPSLPKQGQSASVTEICKANESIAANTGQIPWMLRPPYGEYNSGTQAAAGQCGIDYVVHWSVSLPSDHLIYQEGASLRPGDIILTHFRWDLMDYLPQVMADIEKQGFRVARLEDYLPPKG